MNHARVVIQPRRSLAFFALLSLLLVIFSYTFALLLGAACVYLPYLLITSLQRVPGQLFLFLFAGALLALTIVWSLLPRWEKFEPPGMLLKRSEHPKLFAELDQIAATLKERLPRQVYLVWGVTAFVADRGGILGFWNRRILAIGLPLFSILTVSEFRAILAHEFAHFYGGDTRLGPFVYKSKSAMARTHQNVTKVRSAANIWVIQAVNGIASAILEWYFHLFLRIINFISRKQEFRADEIACLVAGAGPMREGLKKIHGATLPWVMYWGMEIQALIDKGVLPPIGGGFEKFLSTPEFAPEFENAIKAELAEGKTDPYDSHPSLGERIAATEKLSQIAPDSESSSAMELLSNPSDMEERFLRTLDPKFCGKTFNFLEWSELATKVTIPEWKALVESNLGLLAGLTTDTIPDQAKKVIEMGKKLSSPPDELWSLEQRAQKATSLLAFAVGLLLLERGWQIHSQPGNFHLYLGDERAEVMRKIQALSRGEMSADEWAEHCEKWGITGLGLASGMPASS